MASSTSPSSSSSSGDARRGQHNGTPPAAALTTVWRPPCPGGPISWDRSRTVLPRVEAFSPCLPEGWVTTGYFSPAICPSGYVSACGRFDAAQGPPVEAGETAVLCGPPGFTCNAKDAVYAKSDAFDAPMIQIRWRSSDISILQTHPLSPTSPVTAAGGSQTATADTAASAADGGHGAGNGLPPGAIAAIIVGSMVAVALVVLAGLLVCRHRRARRGGHSRYSQSPDRQRQRRGTDLRHPREPELPAEEVLVDDKKRPPFYNRRAATRDSAAATVSDKRRLQRLQQRLQQSQQQQQEQQQQQQQEQQQQHQQQQQQQQPRPCELSATVVDVQEAAAYGPCGLPGEWGALYHYDHAQHQVSDITLTATAESRASPVSTPAATGGGGGGELEELRTRHARIEARRQRLRELQLLDEEEGMVRRRLAEIQGDR